MRSSCGTKSNYEICSIEKCPDENKSFSLGQRCIYKIIKKHIFLKLFLLLLILGDSLWIFEYIYKLDLWTSVPRGGFVKHPSPTLVAQQSATKIILVIIINLVKHELLFNKPTLGVSGQVCRTKVCAKLMHFILDQIHSNNLKQI